MRIVKTDLRGLNAIQIQAKARMVYNNVNGNPLFPAPVPSMAEFGAALDELGTAITSARYGGRILVFKKNMAVLKVTQWLRQLAGSVSAAAAGNERVVLAAGLDMRRRSTRIAALAAPTRLRAHYTGHTGRIYLRWAPVHGARTYQMYVCEGALVNDQDWRMIGTTSGSRHMVTDLESGRFYYFRVQAIGAAGTSPMSNVSRGLAA